MDRQDLRDHLIVDETHLARLQDDVESTVARLTGDHLGEGIAWGLALEQATPTANLTLRVTAGAAYSSELRRVAVPTTTTVNLAVDHLSASTAPSGVGMERVIAVYLRPARTQEEAFSDPAADPTTGFLRQRETFELLVVAGDSAPTATPPVSAPPTAPAGAACVLLGRVRRVHGQTAVFGHQILLADVVRAARAADLHADAVQRRLEVSPTDPPSMRVMVVGGAVQINGSRVPVPSGTSPTFVAPTLYPCIALLGVDWTGNFDIRYGEEAPSPLHPVASGLMPVAWIGIDPGQTAILDEHLDDARPWLAADTAAMRMHRVVATGGEETLTLPFHYQPTANRTGLLVTVNGQLLDASQFTEVSSNAVQLAPLTAADVVVVRALDVAPLDDDRAGLLVGGEVSCDAAGRVYTEDIPVCVLGGRALSYAKPASLPGIANEAPSHWRYLYAEEGSTPGLLDNVLRLAPPDAGRVFASDTRLRRYLAPVRFGPSGNPHPFRRVGREHVWLRAKIAGDTEVLAAGTASTDTAVSLAAWVPPHGRVVRLFVALETPDTGGGAWIGAVGDDHPHLLRAGSGNSYMYCEREITIEVSEAQELVYRVTEGCNLTVAVVSFGD